MQEPPHRLAEQQQQQQLVLEVDKPRKSEQWQFVARKRLSLSEQAQQQQQQAFDGDITFGGSACSNNACRAVFSNVHVTTHPIH